MAKILRIFKKKLLKTLAKSAPSNRFRIFLLRKCGYKIGNNVYIGEDFLICDELDSFENVLIEDRASIAARVTLITHSTPNFSRIYPYVKIVKNGKISIKKDAWVGSGSIILPNVTIGEGGVVGAGAVVTKDVQPFTIVVGNPARFLKRLDVK